MIDGFRIELTADELVRHLDAQIRHHHDRAVECDTKRIRFQAADDEREMRLAACWTGYDEDLERRAARHQRHAAALTFVREHIVVHEIYRLGIVDLRELGLWTARRAGAAERWIVYQPQRARSGKRARPVTHSVCSSRR
jgi:hypothetical protein